jgi:hypothetical protein
LSNTVCRISVKFSFGGAGPSTYIVFLHQSLRYYWVLCLEFVMRGHLSQSKPVGKVQADAINLTGLLQYSAVMFSMLILFRRTVIVQICLVCYFGNNLYVCMTASVV